MNPDPGLAAPVTFDSRERRLLAELADVLIPAGAGFPAASAAGVGEAGLDQVLAARPDLAPGLKQILAAAQGCGSVAFMAGLAQRDPAAFGLLTELVPGAYFLNTEVRALLGYSGQTPRPLESQSDYEDLLQSVRDRGRVYRPTPTAP